MSPATLFKKRLWYRCFPMNFAKFLRTPFLTEHLGWLLLYLHKYLSIIVEQKLYIYKEVVFLIWDNAMI